MIFGNELTIVNYLLTFVQNIGVLLVNYELFVYVYI